MIVIKDLVSQMTVRDKVLQLSQLSVSFYKDGLPKNFTGPMNGLSINDAVKNGAGSIIGEYDAETLWDIQSSYLGKNTYGIPVIVMADVVHGYKTIFPIPLALSCSWSPELMEQTTRIAAIEASACGVHATFAPMADLVRDPRWGRVMEATGEDPYLNSLFSAAAVRGFQGDSLKEDTSVASCVKHFAGYGVPEGGREYNTVDISKGMLREYYLSGYKAAVDAGCRLVMTAFNTIDRVPATCNKWLLQDILRDEWQFDGTVISDWNAVDELIAHGVAENGTAAAKMALEAGVDMDMMSGHYFLHLEEAVACDAELMKALDKSVERVLQLKSDLGLFEKPYKGINLQEAAKTLLCADHRKAAGEAAKKSIVLLKNNGILPLCPDGKIAVAGSMAKTNMLMGNWSCQGKPEECITLKEGMEALGAKAVFVREAFESPAYVTACCTIGRKYGTVLVVTGEHQADTGESTSKVCLDLPKKDKELIRRLSKQGIKVVTVIYSGRPLIITEEDACSSAVVQAWFLGSESGNALASILYGKSEPQGRLTMTFPRHQGQIPVYYNCFSTGRPKLYEGNPDRYVSRYIDCLNTPLYPFGYGLLYTNMEYSELSLSGRTLCENEELTVSVKIKNTGSCRGTETVQLYLRDHAGSVVRPMMGLIAFEQVLIEPQQEQYVFFRIGTQQLGLVNADGVYEVQSGMFTIMAGKNSQEFLAAEFELK